MSWVEQTGYCWVKPDSGYRVIDNVNRCWVMVTDEQYGMDAELKNHEEAEWQLDEQSHLMLGF